MSKKQPKLTPWFKWSIKPVHVGEYETQWLKGGTVRRRVWNGSAWMHPYEPRVSAIQLFYWRGLAEDPVAKTIRGIA
jgi:hypothetical protein